MKWWMILVIILVIILLATGCRDPYRWVFHQHVESGGLILDFNLGGLNLDECMDNLHTFHKEHTGPRDQAWCDTNQEPVAPR